MSFYGQAPEVLERVQGRGGELQLQKRGEHYEFIYNGVFLMATYNGAAESAAVRNALHILSGKFGQGLQVLLGGLGVGYSLQEALRWPQVEKVAVAEIEAKVIEWNYQYLYRYNGNALKDRRTCVVNTSFQGYCSSSPSHAFHLVMVDTDNGSSWLSRPENAQIYTDEGLTGIRRLLVPGGIACFFTPQREENLEQGLQGQYQGIVFEEVMESTGQQAGFYLAVKS